MLRWRSTHAQSARDAISSRLMPRSPGHVEGAQVGLRVAESGASGEASHAFVGEHGVGLVDRETDALLHAQRGARVVVLAQEGVKELLAAHVAQLAAGLFVEPHRPASLA